MMGLVAQQLQLEKNQEGFITQTPTPLNRSTCILKTLTPQLQEKNTIFVILRVLFIIYEIFRIFEGL